MVVLGMPMVTAGRGLGATVDLGELLVGAGQADLESFDFAVPAFAFGFGDAGGEVVADLDEAWLLVGVGPEHRAADAGVLMDARGGERPPAGADRDFALLEVTEEFLPFLVGGGSVFVAGPQGTSSGEEGEVGLDGFFGVDGLVAHGDVDVAVTGDDLGDVRRQAVHHGVGDEHPTEVMRRVAQRLPVDGVDEAGVSQSAAKQGCGPCCRRSPGSRC